MVDPSNVIRSPKSTTTTSIVDTLRSNLLKLNTETAKALVSDFDNNKITGQQFVAQARTLSNLTKVDQAGRLRTLAERYESYDKRLVALSQTVQRTGVDNRAREQDFKVMEQILR